MLTSEKIQTVLISTEPTPTGTERIVVAFREGEDLYIPLDKGRAANQDLLNCEQLYIRETDSLDEYAIYAVKDHRIISTADRQRFEACVRKPISVTTEVLHVTGTHVSVGMQHKEPEGFVAVIDGSERARRALGPAIAIAGWYGRRVQVCAVTAGEDDRDTTSAIQLQIEGTGLDERDVTFVSKSDLEGRLFDWMRQGHILVASAFGVWAADGRLHSMVNGLVRHNAPAIVGVGPKVPADWKPRNDQPVVIFVDASEHAHDIVDRLDPLLSPPRGPLMVVHVTTEDPPDVKVANDVATEINKRWGLPVEAKNVQGRSAAEAIATIASTVDAQLAVVTSWHRPQAGAPRVASTSVASVAHAPCPVMILSSQ